MSWAGWFGAEWGNPEPIPHIPEDRRCWRCTKREISDDNCVELCEVCLGELRDSQMVSSSSVSPVPETPYGENLETA